MLFIFLPVFILFWPTHVSRYYEQAINLSQCAKLEGDLGKATKCWRHVQELRFAKCSKLEGDLSCLASLLALTTVEFPDCAKLTGSFANAFPASVSLADTSAIEGATPEGQESVIVSSRGHPQLRVLSFQKCCNLEGFLRDLAHLTALRELEITQCSQVTGDLQHLSDLIELRILRLEECGRLRGDLSCLARCSKLEIASFYGCSFHGTSQAIAHWPNVEMLDCRGCLVAVPDGCPRGTDRNLHYKDRAACLELGAWIRIEVHSGMTGSDERKSVSRSSRHSKRDISSSTGKN